MLSQYPQSAKTLLFRGFLGVAGGPGGGSAAVCDPKTLRVHLLGIDLSNTLISCAVGFWVSQHEEIGCDTPPPTRCDALVEGGISAILAGYHMKTGEQAERTPSAILSQKGIARYGGYLALSH